MGTKSRFFISGLVSAHKKARFCVRGHRKHVEPLQAYPRGTRSVDSQEVVHYVCILTRIDGRKSTGELIYYEACVHDRGPDPVKSTSGQVLYITLPLNMSERPPSLTR